jgi:hypothetical protein
VPGGGSHAVRRKPRSGWNTIARRANTRSGRAPIDLRVKVRATSADCPIDSSSAVLSIMRTQFPTRQLLPALTSTQTSRALNFNMRVSATTSSESVADSTNPTPRLLQFLHGVDATPKLMPLDDIVALGDVFTREILLKGDNPLTLRALLTAVAKVQSPALPVRKMFLVAEGATFRTAPTLLELNDRLVFTWQISEGTPVDVLLSTVAVADDSAALLQLIAWSEKDRAFHYFERKNGVWAWAGNSFHALDPPTRGQGPFDSHINGSLVMKELKRPWPHWHSMNSSIPREIFGDSEFNKDPIFQSLEGAEILENIVRTGVRRWTKSRFTKETEGAQLNNLTKYFRQVLWCTSVNLVSSRTVYSNQAVAAFDLPTSFFFDVEGIEFLANALGNADVIPARQFEVDAALYRHAIETKVVGVTDNATPPNRVAGDTHFAFLVPERAFEDQVVLNELVTRSLLSFRLALCLLMVDFSNPVFSADRATLLRYVPNQIEAGAGGGALDQVFINAVRQANAPSGSPEAELLRFWESSDLIGLVAGSLASYRAAVSARLQSRQGIEDLIDLADSRREAFASTRSLAEFNATLARGQQPSKHLAMHPDATVFLKSSDVGEGEL